MRPIPPEKLANWPSNSEAPPEIVPPTLPDGHSTHWGLAGSQENSKFYGHLVHLVLEGAGDQQDSVEKYPGLFRVLQCGSGSSPRSAYGHSSGLPQCNDGIWSRQRPTSILGYTGGSSCFTSGIRSRTASMASCPAFRASASNWVGSLGDLSVFSYFRAVFSRLITAHRWTDGFHPATDNVGGTVDESPVIV